MVKTYGLVEKLYGYCFSKWLGEIKGKFKESRRQQNIWHWKLVLTTILERATLVNQGDNNKEVISINDGKSNNGTAIISGANLAIWLLAVLACHDEKCKIAIMEAGAIEVLTDRIANCFS